MLQNIKKKSKFVPERIKSDKGKSPVMTVLDGNKNIYRSNETSCF